MLALTEKEIQSIDGMLESKMAWARSKSAEAEQLALDCTRLLSCTEERLGQIQNQGFFKRCWNRLSGQTGAMERANTADLIQMQKVSLRYINMLQEQQMMTAHSLLALKNNLVTLAIKEEETRKLVGLLAERTLQRFQDLEKRVDQLEISQNLQGWLLTLEDRDYDVNYPTPYLRMLKIINDFYGYKSGGWNYNDMLFMRKALRTVGLNPKEQISMNMFVDTLVEEIKKQGFDTYRELLIAHIPSDKDDFGYFAIENVSSQVFTTVNGIYTQYTDKSEVIEALSDELSISPEAALKRLLARTISKLNVDLDCQLPLSDVAAEMLVGLKLTNQLLIEDSVQQEIKEECIEQTDIECIDSDKADDIPSVQKDNQFVDVMKWDEPEWKIRTTPKTKMPDYFRKNYLNNVLCRNNKIIFVTGYGSRLGSKCEMSFYTTKDFDNFSLYSSIETYDMHHINDIWFCYKDKNFSYDGEHFNTINFESCSDHDIDIENIIYDNGKWYFICTYPIKYTYIKSGFLFDKSASSTYKNPLIITSDDLITFNILYNFKTNDDFYKHEIRECCIHDGKIVISTSKNCIIFSDGGKEWKKVVDEIRFVKNIFWNNNRFNIIASDKIYYSEDGKEWSFFELDFDYRFWEVYFFENEHIILFEKEKSILCTNDLKNIKEIQIPFDGKRHSYFISGGNLFINKYIGSGESEEVFAYWNFNK